MKKLLLITAIFLNLSINNAYSESFEPLELAKQLFDHNVQLNIKDFVIGEYKGIPNGKDLQKEDKTKFLLLKQTDKKAVVSMTIFDAKGNGFDSYLFFEKDKTWKMNAFRALAMTGMTEQLKIYLENLSDTQIKEIINSKEETKMFTSKEDYDYQLGNAKLTLELDEKIIAHFVKNKAEFERLKKLFLAKKNFDAELKKAVRKVYIYSIRRGVAEEYDNCINFLIGGMLDNTVGYLYIKDKKDLPEITSKGVIMLREIVNGWYIYKTT